MATALGLKSKYLIGICEWAALKQQSQKPSAAAESTTKRYKNKYIQTAEPETPMNFIINILLLGHV